MHHLTRRYNATSIAELVPIRPAQVSPYRQLVIKEIASPVRERDPFNFADLIEVRLLALLINHPNIKQAGAYRIQEAARDTIGHQRPLSPSRLSTQGTTDRSPGRHNRRARPRTPTPRPKVPRIRHRRDTNTMALRRRRRQSDRHQHRHRPGHQPSKTHHRRHRHHHRRRRTAAPLPAQRPSRPTAGRNPRAGTRSYPHRPTPQRLAQAQHRLGLPTPDQQRESHRNPRRPHRPTRQLPLEPPPLRHEAPLRTQSIRPELHHSPADRALANRAMQT